MKQSEYERHIPEYLIQCENEEAPVMEIFKFIADEPDSKIEAAKFGFAVLNLISNQIISVTTKGNLCLPRH